MFYLLLYMSCQLNKKAFNISMLPAKEWAATPVKWCMILMSVLFFASQSVRAAERIALVIANANYEFASLKNPLNDAKDLAKILRKLGFKVVYKQNAGQETMEEAIHAFGQRLKGDTMGLFYFSGHGVQYQGENYLIPIGFPMLSATKLRYKAVAAAYVLEEMGQAGNSMKVIILDACRNNPFMSGYKGFYRGLARMRGISGSLIAYATAPDSVALDGNGRNSPYTKHLLRFISQPGLSIEQLFKQVRVSVLEETNGLQTPWEHSSLTGDFYFAGKPKKANPDKVTGNGSQRVPQAEETYVPADFDFTALLKRRQKKYNTLEMLYEGEIARIRLLNIGLAKHNEFTMEDIVRIQKVGQSTSNAKRQRKIIRRKTAINKHQMQSAQREYIFQEMLYDRLQQKIRGEDRGRHTLLHEEIAVLKTHIEQAKANVGVLRALEESIAHNNLVSK